MSNDWLKKYVDANGIFDNARCMGTAKIIKRALRKLGSDYTHSKLIAEMDFGFWRYLFSQLPTLLLANRQLFKHFIS